MLTIHTLTTDDEINPIGTETRRPAFGWRLVTAESVRNVRQSAYRLIVASSLESLMRDEGDIWDTGRVASDRSQYIAYEGPVPESAARYYWKVKVWDRDGQESPWSNEAYWETGLLDEREWEAKWIAAPFSRPPEPEPDLLRGEALVWDGENAEDGRNRLFRLVFDCGPNPPAQAKLHVLATDSLRIWVNGSSEGLFYPYLQTVVLDIAALLVPGDNVLAMIADGEKQGFVAMLSLAWADGTVRTLGTDAGWRVFDREEEGWKMPAFDDRHWREPKSNGRVGNGEWEHYKRILYPVNVGYGPLPVFGSTLRIAKPVRRARLYVSALGLYVCTLNGQRVNGDVLAPGWMDYRVRIPYRTYDIAACLRRGDNRLEAIVGPGWYAGHLGICGPFHYGSTVAFRAELRIEYEDGLQERWGTDESWQAAESPVLSADLYMGETYDARLERKERRWQPAIVPDQLSGGRMTAAQGPAIVRARELPPKSVVRVDATTYLVDFGQNMTGWLRLTSRGPSGTRIRIRYAERLGADGRLYMDNLRTAKQTDIYLMSGEGKETYEPSFTYHGFQYAEIEGYPGELDAGALTGIVIHSDAAEVGELEASHPLLNRLLSNIRWSQRGNFIGIPLDCPQRDERLGWTGDAHAFARTATYNMNAASFYRKWLTDIRDAQRDDGAYPNVAPDVVHFGAGHVFFGDCGVILPWTMYRVYGDVRFILENYEAMKKWIQYLENDSDDEGIRRTESFGDHLAFGAETPKKFINLAFFAYSVKLMAQMADTIGETADGETYGRLLEKLRIAFQNHFMTADGHVACRTQTAYVLALMIGLLTAEQEPAAVRDLVDNIRDNGWHLTTGFMGVSYILEVLSRFGETDAAFRLLLQEEFPSWLYPVRNGATTIWERWDGWSAERGFQDPEMNSFNHYALGSVGEWLYRRLAGIDLREDGAGFQSFLIRPQPGGGIGRVRCRYETLYGPIAVGWREEAGAFTLEADIPANSNAEVAVPCRSGCRVEADGMPVEPGSEGNGWSFLRREGEAVWLVVGSGRYQFRTIPVAGDERG
ncbi:alpha-L-rhamnosidase [Cohnella zeiphila]|uniref:alpha-L-rhamnosidase n=1 Tax=Cohnella zeiphila TaxID=2761120 RepID=A0A7X0VZV9_9BACL|nr:alpha-L-rhamnosidase [Cohnella zeiphila]MBB6734378.1 family 78 glycoside hydrolase catalytic domain [Cohnella zeiphila]